MSDPLVSEKDEKPGDSEDEQPDISGEPVSSNISLRGLRTFCVAADYENFRQAGEALFITPSAVSHQVKSLEDELGRQLFDRTSRSLELTATGKALYEEISPLIRQLETIVAGYRAGGRRSAVRISVQPFFASELFVPRLREFTAAHPEIDIRVGTSDESAEVHPSTADLSIRLFRTPPTDMRSDLLFPLRMVPAGSPEFKKKMRVRKGSIVGDFPLIVHETRPEAWRRWAKEAGIRLPQDPKIIRLDSMIAAARAAERGVGAALVPVPLGNGWFESGSLVRLFDQEIVADVSYYLVCKETLAGDESVSQLRAWILETFSDLE